MMAVEPVASAQPGLAAADRLLSATRLDPSALDAAMIDLDGTLVDTLGDFEAALGATLLELGQAALTSGFIALTVGKGSEHLVRCTLAEVGAPPALYDQAWAAYQRHYAQINGHYAHVYPGALRALQDLAKAGIVLACLTNKPGAAAEQLLRRKGLHKHFRHVFGGDAFARRKPDPLPLLETCRALGMPAARTLMVGDSSNDAQAARAAGCPVVLMSYGYNHGQSVHDSRPDAVFNGLDELSHWWLAQRRAVLPSQRVPPGTTA